MTVYRSKPDKHGNDYPVQDATFNIFLYPNAQDKEAATPGDPKNCVMVKCAERMGCLEAEFGQGTAYLLMKIKSKVGWHRFTYRKDDVYQAIKNYDATQTFPEESFVLKPPRPSYSLDAKREQSQRAREKARRGEPTKPRARAERKEPIFLGGELIGFSRAGGRRDMHIGLTDTEPN
jgi:hypothetical protein